MCKDVFVFDMVNDFFDVIEFGGVFFDDFEFLIMCFGIVLVYV